MSLNSIVCSKKIFSVILKIFNILNKFRIILIFKIIIFILIYIFQIKIIQIINMTKFCMIAFIYSVLNEQTIIHCVLNEQTIIYYVLNEQTTIFFPRCFYKAHLKLV